MESFWRNCIICLFLGFACLFESGNATPNVTLDYKICNGETFNWNEDNLVQKMDEVLDMAVGKVADNGYNYYASIRDENTDFQCWAHAACNGKLTWIDCYACVVRAHDLLMNQCRRNYGAQFQLIDCRVRREKYEFNED
ncbi:hypothetical protein MLD38_036191 [Melastoma candidum]|uniref:Uncharacterized protein n=1 Tax=Melastoma candidum TaxID=119954 RepID=A0ACB9LJ49_9MYRT|nr:hypothetical protein MLD38_036191 [Melastoma candidum]